MALPAIQVGQLCSNSLYLVTFRKYYQMLHAIKKKLKCRGQPLYDDFSSTTLVSENQTLSVPNLYHNTQAEGECRNRKYLVVLSLVDGVVDATNLINHTITIRPP